MKVKGQVTYYSHEYPTFWYIRIGQESIYGVDVDVDHFTNYLWAYKMKSTTMTDIIPKCKRMKMICVGQVMNSLYIDDKLVQL